MDASGLGCVGIFSVFFLFFSGGCGCCFQMVSGDIEKGAQREGLDLVLVLHTRWPFPAPLSPSEYVCGRLLLPLVSGAFSSDRF